jgi:hypothetical protein
VEKVARVNGKTNFKAAIDEMIKAAEKEFGELDREKKDVREDSILRICNVRQNWLSVRLHTH